ncbi:Hypothetical predicted protein, partial [Paramuricea clavata]
MRWYVQRCLWPCKTNSTFLLDTDCLANAEDVKADDNGKFRHNGEKIDFVELSEGQVRQIKEKPDTLERGQYKLSRTYWVHSSNSDFKRRLTELEDHSGDKSPVVILQYQFSGDPTDITVEQHKNAKKIPKPFYVTAKSTRDKISQKAQTALGPSSIYDELYEDGGGILDKTASCTVPRSVSQVKYERGKLRKQHSKDELAELIEKCKQSQGSFVHSLQVGPDIRVVLATKSQLEDLVKFCCDPESFSILGVDVTYNIGHFYVTTTTYNHLMLVTRETGTSPTFPGPMMMHTKESSEDFHYFGSTLKEQNHEVLLQYDDSRKVVFVDKFSDIVNKARECFELNKGNVLIVQKYDEEWSEYIDCNSFAQINTGDKLKIILNQTCRSDDGQDTSLNDSTKRDLPKEKVRQVFKGQKKIKLSTKGEMILEPLQEQDIVNLQAQTEHESIQRGQIYQRPEHLLKPYEKAINAASEEL